MTAFTNHFLFEFKTGLRNSTAMLMFYLFPLMFYAMMGLIMVKINPVFANVLIPAMVIFVCLVSNLLGLPGGLVDSREAGIYRSFKINGVPALSILAAPTLSTIFHALIVSIIIALTANPLFGGVNPTNWGAFAWITLLVVLNSGALGALIGVIATSSRSSVLLSQLIFLPSMLIGGLMIPLEMLPASVRPVSMLFPSTHAMQAYTGLAYGQATTINPWVSVAILLSSGLLAYGLAIYLFNWDNRNQVRRGHPALALLVLVPFLIGILI